MKKLYNYYTWIYSWIKGFMKYISSWIYLRDCGECTIHFRKLWVNLTTEKEKPFSCDRMSQIKYSLLCVSICRNFFNHIINVYFLFSIKIYELYIEKQGIYVFFLYKNVCLHFSARSFWANQIILMKISQIINCVCRRVSRMWGGE